VGQLKLVGVARNACSVWWAKMKEGNPVKVPKVGKRIILQWTLTSQHRAMKCIHVAQEREKWQAVNTVLKSQASQISRNL